MFDATSEEQIEKVSFLVSLLCQPDKPGVLCSSVVCFRLVPSHSKPFEQEAPQRWHCSVQPNLCLMISSIGGKSKSFRKLIGSSLILINKYSFQNRKTSPTQLPMHYLFYPRCMSFLFKLRYFSHQFLHHSVKIFNRVYSKIVKYFLIILLFG